MLEFFIKSFQKFLNFLNTLSESLLNKKSSYRIQSFTYYIPAPPPRKTGYREKEFDKIFYSFINAGYDIISIHTESHIGPQSSGLWVMVLVRATSEKTDRLDLANDISERENPELSISNDINLFDP